MFIERPQHSFPTVSRMGNVQSTGVEASRGSSPFISAESDFTVPNSLSSSAAFSIHRGSLLLRYSFILNMENMWKLALMVPSLDECAVTAKVTHLIEYGT